MKIQQEITKEEIFNVLDNVSEGLMLFDESGNLLFVNNEAQKIFDIFEIKKDLINKSIEEFSNFSPLNNLFYLLGRDIKEFFRKELEIKRNLILEITSSYIIRQGEKTGALILIRDITREKIIERTKTEFVTISAHQLRTPLSVIQWNLERLLGERPGKLTEEQRTLIEKAFEDNKRMISLINDLLNMVKIEEGKHIYNLESADLVNIIDSVVKYYKNQIKEKNLKFEFHDLGKLPKVKVDVEQISFVIQNLLDNAIKYTLPGGRITIKVFKKDKEIEFSIEDTGIGIPKDQHNNILKKFFRASNAIKRETDGNGTGLFIAKNIIESHKGRIWFDSEENKGTKFWFTLPI